MVSRNETLTKDFKFFELFKVNLFFSRFVHLFLNNIGLANHCTKELKKVDVRLYCILLKYRRLPIVY